MQKMKYSGVEWIGEIPEDRRIIRNKYALSFIKGKIPSEINTEQKGIPYIGASDLDTLSGNANYLLYTSDVNVPMCNSEDVLVLWDGARAGLIGKNHTGAISSTIVKITPDQFINKHFFFWYLKGFEKYLYECVNGTTIPHMNKKYVEDIMMIDWSLDDQKRIADFLDDKCGKIDRYIEKQQRIIDKLKEYKQAVITEAVTKGLDPDAPMKDSGIEWIGMIPEHWEVPEIKYLVRIASGGTPDRNHPEYWNGNIPWIKTGELQNDIITNAEEYITEEGLNNSSAQVFNINTILVAMYGQGKTRGMTALLKTPASTNQACAGLTVTNSNVQIEYLWQCLIGAYDAIRSEAAGSGQPNLSATLIGNFHIALPPIEEQGLIVEYIKDRTVEIKSTIHKAEKLLEKLTEYKKSLIYEAVTGKKEV